MYITEIESRIDGIPCLIGVTYYTAVEGCGTAYSAASDIDYLGYCESEWEVCDRRGRFAPWLERKLTDKDRQRIEGEIANHFECEV